MPIFEVETIETVQYRMKYCVKAKSKEQADKKCQKGFVEEFMSKQEIPNSYTWVKTEAVTKVED